MNQYCMYLRKSRADDEAELRGEGETLARHEKILTDLALHYQLPISKIYREVVSGETIAARPVMQQLLTDVEQGVWDGVFVVEVERLARGNSIDQGIISQTFKYADTKIITPIKTYDPNNEFDEEYFEFGLFMSRREYKTINRRLNQGRLASVKEGKYVGSVPPYGYVRKKIKGDKGNTLEPHPEQAPIIRLVFEWYTVGCRNEKGILERLGVSLIVRKLNSLGIKSKKGGVWVNASIQDILINPVYMGKIRWNWRKANKKMVDGNVTVTRKRGDLDDCLLVDGLHEPLISEATFYKAREIRLKNRRNPVAKSKEVKNPLSGLVICGKCGRRMQRRPYSSGQEPSLICTVTSCNNVSSALSAVEERILDALGDWLSDEKFKWSKEGQEAAQKETVLKQETLTVMDKEIEKLEKQLTNIFNSYEQGIYTIELFKQRHGIISDQLENVKQQKQILLDDVKKDKVIQDNRSSIIPKLENILAVYRSLDNAGAKNQMLKNVLEKVEYLKETDGRGGNPDNFEIVLHPKNPHF